jgi:hypothetical protein
LPSLELSGTNRPMENSAHERWDPSVEGFSKRL